MRTIGAALLAATLLVSNAFAATATAPAGPLAPGKPAGVKKAQSENNTTLLWIIGAGLVIGGIALVASGNGNDNVGNTTTASGT